MVDKKETIGFDKLIQVFCRENYNKFAKLHYLGPLLSNLTQIKDARLALLDKEHYVIQRLLPYTEYADSLVRRGGIVGALKNCCFETGETNASFFQKCLPFKTFNAIFLLISIDI